MAYNPRELASQLPSLRTLTEIRYGAGWGFDYTGKNPQHGGPELVQPVLRLAMDKSDIEVLTQLLSDRLIHGVDLEFRTQQVLPQPPNKPTVQQPTTRFPNVTSLLPFNYSDGSHHPNGRVILALEREEPITLLNEKTVRVNIHYF